MRNEEMMKKVDKKSVKKFLESLPIFKMGRHVITHLRDKTITIETVGFTQIQTYRWNVPVGVHTIYKEGFEPRGTYIIGPASNDIHGSGATGELIRATPYPPPSTP
jgi:hypothetical protein